MINRRKFLERSVLGAGGVLFSSALLQSCRKNQILPDMLPMIDFHPDWNDLAKGVVADGVGEIPAVGAVLSGLVNIFWPASQEDVWGKVKNQVETYVNQKMSDDTYKKVQGNLQGLQGVTINYLDAIKNNGNILYHWINVSDDFTLYLSNFREPEYELPLLGLFGQFANMHLALLRDGVIYGKSWGLNDAEVEQVGTNLTAAIKDYTNYVAKTFSTGAVNLISNTKRDDHKCEPFRTVNAYSRSMTLTVLDFADTWPYYDVTIYKDGAKNPDGTPIKVITREIYSDPYGTCDDSGEINTPYPYPTQFPTQLSVWGGDRIDAVQLTYPAGSGPNRVTQTPRMGDSSGGSNQPPHGGLFKIAPNNPIIQAKVNAGDIVNGLQFMFYENQSVTSELGEMGTTDLNWQGYIDNCLSSVYINGVSRFYGSADCVVFGYLSWVWPTSTLSAIRSMYVTSPKERSVADFAKSYPNHSIPANLITTELKAARSAYWAHIKARAK